MKMVQKWIRMLVIMAFYQEVASGPNIKEGNSVSIRCNPEPGSLIIWIRVLEKSGMEFIASFSNAGGLKQPGATFNQLYTYSNGQLTLKSFNKERDSGLYGCAALYKGNELKFGSVTRLVGEEPVKRITEAPQPEATTCQLTTSTPCVCTSKEESSDPSMDCSLLILGPLAGGCGLLLLLLVVTILYCNKIRTRRCPHHYKRKPRGVAPEKQMMTGRHG